MGVAFYKTRDFFFNCHDLLNEKAVLLYKMFSVKSFED